MKNVSLKNLIETHKDFPKEDILFSITLFPLTTYEHKHAGFK